MSSLTAILEQYALSSLEKQEKLRTFVGDLTSEIDLDAGVIRFSEDIQFPFQVLGTESDNTLTWLWAWADEQTEVPSELLRSSLDLKAWGETEGLPEFTAPSVDLSTADGTIVSLIATEICEASCYYQDEYEGGALFLLLFGDVVDRLPGFTVDSLFREFSQLASLYEFDHRNAFRSYLSGRNMPFTEHDTFIVSELESGEDVRANFDRSGRLVSINGKTV